MKITQSQRGQEKRIMGRASLGRLKTNSKMIDLNPIILIIVLKYKWASQFKGRDCKTGFYKMQNSSISCL